MRLVVVSGLSGAGKSVALHALEDLGYYCIDNLPAQLLPGLVEELVASGDMPERIALGLDVRSSTTDLAPPDISISDPQGPLGFRSAACPSIKKTSAPVSFSQVRMACSSSPDTKSFGVASSTNPYFPPCSQPVWPV